MFSTQEVVDALKGATFDRESIQGLSHCQLLETKARQLGFESYHHFRTWLTDSSAELLEEYSLGLMRKICELRLPTLDCAYYEFMMLPNQGVGFYSYFIGWDKHAQEVRVPRPLHGLPTAIGLRKLAKHPIYVIESSKELVAWQWNWHATALMPKALAKEAFPHCFNKRHLVDANPPLHLINGEDLHASNIAHA